MVYSDTISNYVIKNCGDVENTFYEQFEDKHPNRLFQIRFIE